MPAHAAIRLASQLNAAHLSATSAEVAARAIVGGDAAHHVLDPDDLAGLDPLNASDLDVAIRAVTTFHGGGWVLALPRPGHLLPLRGPATLSSAALEAGTAVVHADGGIAWVPQRVGPAIQWRLHAAASPLDPTSLAEAERHLSELVLDAGRVLADLDMASGTHPGDTAIELPPAYSPRSRRAAHRAALLWEATEVALADGTDVLHSHGLGVRDRVLRELHAAAAEALAAAVSHPGRTPDPRTPRTTGPGPR